MRETKSVQERFWAKVQKQTEISSPRTHDGNEMNHAVVGMINSEPERPVLFDMIHDPHPDNTFLKPDSLWGLGFLCALNPAVQTIP